MDATPDPPPPDAPPGAPGPRRAPAPLLVAALLVAVEAMLLLLQGIAELVAVSSDRLVMGVTTSLFFLVYGVGLAVSVWALLRLSSWARAPIVVAQLIQILVGWSFLGGGTTAVAVTLWLIAGVVLLGIFHPATTAALADQDD